MLNLRTNKKEQRFFSPSKRSLKSEYLIFSVNKKSKQGVLILLYRLGKSRTKLRNDVTRQGSGYKTLKRRYADARISV